MKYFVFFISIFLLFKIEAQVVTISKSCNGGPFTPVTTFPANVLPCIPIEICRNCKMKIEYSFPTLSEPNRTYYENLYNGISGTEILVFNFHLLGQNNNSNSWVSNNFKGNILDLTLSTPTMNEVSQIAYNFFGGLSGTPPEPGPGLPPSNYFTLNNLCINIVECGDPIVNCELCCNLVNSSGAHIMVDAATGNYYLVPPIGLNSPCGDGYFEVKIVGGGSLFFTGSVPGNMPYNIESVCYKFNGCPECGICLNVNN